MASTCKGVVNVVEQGRLRVTAVAIQVLQSLVVVLFAPLYAGVISRGFGIPFVGMPRTREAASAREAGQPVTGPGLLALACVALAVGAPVMLTVLSRAVRAVTGVTLGPLLLPGNLTVIPAHANALRRPVRPAAGTRCRRWPRRPWVPAACTWACTGPETWSRAGCSPPAGYGSPIQDD